MGDAAKGAFWGMLLGASIGLGVCVWLIVDPIFFTGDTVLIGGCVGALGGYFWGENFVEVAKALFWWWP